MRDQEILLRYGQYFLGVLDRADIEEIPITLLIQILERIKLYVELKFPEKQVRPKVGSTVTGFSNITPYKLSATIDVAKQGFTEQLMKIDERNG